MSTRLSLRSKASKLSLLKAMTQKNSLGPVVVCGYDSSVHLEHVFEYISGSSLCKVDPVRTGILWATGTRILNFGGPLAGM